ncbi:hypothetical protein F8B43_0085 [Methylorubrum populi]|uniref:Uncharacterized protein n=1 Tax=Methylorubrum populi TaxID=223967 RepID=A0A833JA58_9HYPH|nr:hypothetical protein F8B43_0085 [Methylorubrum populi]
MIISYRRLARGGGLGEGGSLVAPSFFLAAGGGLTIRPQSQQNTAPA